MSLDLITATKHIETEVPNNTFYSFFVSLLKSKAIFLPNVLPFLVIAKLILTLSFTASIPRLFILFSGYRLIKEHPLKPKIHKRPYSHYG
jgi:hypothetical protein